MLDTFQKLAVRNPKRTEADIQADVRQFIISAPFELEPGDLVDVSLESPVGDRRRIDVEAGSTVIEVKRDLRKDKVKREAQEQLAGYVAYRMMQTGLRYVGVLTDGTEWNCYDLVDGKLRLVSDLTLQETSIMPPSLKALNLDSILSDLKGERNRLSRAIEVLEDSAVSASKEVVAAAKTGRRKTWKMSIEARNRISEAKKKWWAKSKRLKLK